MNFTEFYNKNLMFNFYLDNIGRIPALILLIFIILIFITLWLKDGNSKINFLIKTSLIMVLIYLIVNALFFNNNGIKFLYTTIFKSKEKTNYINYLNKDINENNDFKQIYGYIKYLKENSDKKPFNWNLFNEVSLINTKYYFNGYNNYNNKKENTKNPYFIDYDKIFNKKFGRNYNHFFNMFVFTEMMFFDKKIQGIVTNKITEIEKDNKITNQEFFYLLHNIKEYVLNYDEYSNKYYTVKNNRDNAGVFELEIVLTDKKTQKEFLKLLSQWSNNEIIIKDEISFYKRSVLRKLNFIYYMKYYYGGSKYESPVSYNFSFDTDELFTTLNNDNYKLIIKRLINNITQDNNVTNKEFVNLINDIYIFINLERRKEKRIYDNTTESVYYDYFDKLKN